MTETPEKAPELPMAQRAVRAVRTLRWWMVLPLPLLVIAISSFGPDGWREPAERMLWMSWTCVWAAMAHAGARILMPTLDLSDLIERAKEGNIAAAIVAFGRIFFMAVLFFGMVGHAKGQSVHTYIPANAELLLPMLKDQTDGYWPEHPAPSYFGALIEHESCISLTHSRCWNPRAKLKTAREEGASLGQFTRAWTTTGALRFDAIAEVRALDPEALREFNWSTVYSRADLSMRAILVKQRDCFRRIVRLVPDLRAVDAIHFCDAAYNGGFAGMQTDRRLCADARGCDANRWFGHVEKHSLKSRTKWQGYGKSAFDINRFHVSDVWFTRRPKYMAALGQDRS